MGSDAWQGPQPNPWAFIDLPSVRPAGRGLPQPVDQSAVLEAAALLDDAIAALPLDSTGGAGDGGGGAGSGSGSGSGEWNTSLPAAALAACVPHDLQLLADVVGAPVIPLDVVDAARSPVWQDDAGQAITTLALLLANARSQLVGVDPRFLELPVADLHRTALAAERSNILVRGRRRRAVLDSLASVVSPERRARVRSTSAFTGILLAFSERVDALRLAFSRVRGLEQEPGWNPLLERDAGRLHTRKDWVEWLAHQLDPTMSGTAPLFREALRSVYLRRHAPDARLSALFQSAASAFDALASLLGESSVSLAHSLAPEGGLLEAWRSPPRDPRGAGAALLRDWIALLHEVEPLRPTTPDARAEALARHTSSPAGPR